MAAAMAGLFGSQLEEQGYAGAELLLPLVFALIVLTVVLHGLSIGWLARRLGLASSEPEGILMVGAAPWSLNLAEQLQKLKLPVLVNDASWEKLRPARMANLPVHYGEILSERTEEVLELSHVTRLLALTRNEAYNTLVCSRFAPELGHHKVYAVGWKGESEEDKGHKLPSHAVRSYSIFGKGHYFSDFSSRFHQGWRFRTRSLSEKYPLSHWLENKADDDVLIAALDAKGHIYFYPWQNGGAPADSRWVISFGPEREDEVREESGESASVTQK
ncbi:MAG: hypothetical protein R3E89_09700 [Thiolinea sp.]